MEICRQVLSSVNGNEFIASEVLIRHLLGVTTEIDDTEGEDQDVWVEEQIPIKEIYSTRFTVVDSNTCRVELAPQPSDVLPRNISIEFTKPRAYPNGLPPHMIILSQPKLPAHVRLSLLRQAGLYAWESLKGMGMIYSLADWMEENIERIVKEPGRLSDLEGIVSGEETSGSSGLPAVERNGIKPPRPIDWNPKFPQAEIPVLSSRKSLPAWKHRDDIISKVANCRVVLVTGETGSGKSTQTPQFILDQMISRGLSHAANIICTQPRRISAIGLADRVSEERGEKVGTSVGYIIRGQNKSGRDTKLRFVTTGVLLRRFLDDPTLEGVSHVIVDEVHERTVDGDFLLLLLKQLLQTRNDLTVILMSATLEADEYANYFAQYSVGRVHIEGRTFPVRDIYLESILSRTGYRPPLRRTKKSVEPDLEEYEEGIGEALKILNEGLLDYDLIAKTVELACTEDQTPGAILIFLPGIMP